MDKKAVAEKLLNLLEQVLPLYQAHQRDMLAKREALEFAEREYKATRLTALANASGKNADIREAQASEDITAIRARLTWESAQREFNAAYAAYKDAEAQIAYIRDATALLREG